MIDINNIQPGDSVFWLDADNDVIEHTWIGQINGFAVLSGEINHRPVINHNIQKTISQIAKENTAYEPYPVCFVDIANLYKTKNEADDVAWKNLQISMESEE